MPDRKVVANVELEIMWKEEVVVCMKENAHHFPDDIEGDNKTEILFVIDHRILPGLCPFGPRPGSTDNIHVRVRLIL
jgi:hypothetical protein